MALTIAVVLLIVFVRGFPLKAQDRAITAEEQLRHYVLTGKLLDCRLTMRQIVGLRFASDTEFAALAQERPMSRSARTPSNATCQQWRADRSACSAGGLAPDRLRFRLIELEDRSRRVIVSS